MSFCHKCGTQSAGSQLPTRHGPKASFSLTIGVILALAAAAIVVIALVVGGVLPTQTNPFPAAGETETRTFDLTDFTSVQASSGFRVVITQADTYSIKITADENMFDSIQVQKTGNALTIQLDTFRFSTSVLKAEISMPDLQDVHLSGGAFANATGFNLAHNFNLVLSGGSRLTMTGQAANLTAICSGGSILFFSDFNVNNANLDLSGVSIGHINLDGRLDANVSGGAKLYYEGNATLGNVNTSGGGVISKEN